MIEYPFVPDDRFPERLTIAPLSREAEMQSILSNGGEIDPYRIREATHRHQTGAGASSGVRQGLLGKFGLLLRR